MHPYLEFYNTQIPVYGLIISLAFITGIFLTIITGKRYGIKRQYIFTASMFSAVGMIICSKILYMITKLPLLLQDISYYKDLSLNQILDFLIGGYVFYGGLLGILLGLYIFSRIFGFSSSALFDASAPVIPFVHGFGRIGCFFGGCCYGIEYHGVCHIDYPYNSLSPYLNLVSRFPVQLLESFFNFSLFIFLFFYGRKRRRPGLLISIYLIAYGIIRFILEFFRGDSIRGHIFFFSTSQWISIIIITVVFFINVKKKDEK